MALFKSLTFSNVNSMDYGVYITGSGVYNAPERAVEMFAIPGRNGALAIDGGRYENIEVTYTCGCFANTDAEFSQKIRAFRNAICSQYTYTRLTDEYNPDEYRMALYRSGLETEPFRSKAGEFEITFDCKPQRFLTSGESTYQIGEWGQTITETGDIVTYQGDDLTAVKSLTTDLEPIQDLHGYDHPWVGGAGKNKLPITQATATVNGVTFTVNSNGTVTANGTATANTYFYFMGAAATALDVPDGEYILTGCPTGGSSTTYYIQANNGAWRSDYGSGVTFTSASQNVKSIGIAIKSGVSVNNLVFKPMIRLSSVTDATFAPYSNICPIYGRTGQNVFVTGDNSYIANDITVAASGATITRISDTSFRIQGAGSGSYPASKQLLTVFNLEVDETYICFAYANVNSGKAEMAIRNSSNTILSHSTASTESGWHSFEFTYDATSGYYLSCFSNFGASGGDVVYSDIHIVKSSEYQHIVREFEDSQGNTLTVYGGEDEIVGGVLTVTKKIVDLGSLTWAYNGTSGHEIFHTSTAFTDAKAPSRSSEMPNIICSLYKTAIYSDIYNHMVEGAISIYTNGYIYVVDSRYNNYINFKAAMNGVQLCYKLAEPEVHQLTANEVTTLIGTNNILSDAGEVTVEYGTDPYTMVNDTPFPSKPLIRVTGYGEVGFGDITITITGTAGVVTYIDCDLMECYRMSGGAIVPANQYVTFTGTDFPTIPTGKTRVTSASTISKVEVVPRWWII